MTELLQVNDLWKVVKEELRNLFSADDFEAWFEPIHNLRIEGGVYVLEVASDFAAFWIEDNYMDLLQKHVEGQAGDSIELKLEVKLVEEAPEVSDFPEKSISERQSAVSQSVRSSISSKAKKSKVPAPVLNPKYTFENFVIGPGNEFAHATCVAVAEAPARAYNPLFIYGETGLGKTHLMHAVAHYAYKRNENAKICYISSENFLNEFIESIQQNSLAAYRKKYRSLDLLLIDDIQFLAGKERIQEEFFHTFNELFESQKQILLSSDRPANEISRLESRLVSRFQWGLAADIQAPDLETRFAIIHNKAKAMNLELSEEIIEFLASSVTKNVRCIEGALNRLAGYSLLSPRPVEVPIAEKLLQDFLQEEALNQVTIEKIQKKVCEYFNLRLEDMSSKRRPANIAFPRQIAMYLSRMLTSHSQQEIGNAFGKRDHGTVIHACKTVENIMDQDESVKRKVDYLTKQLSSQAS